jgi:hypothetical protein
MADYSSVRLGLPREPISAAQNIAAMFDTAQYSGKLPTLIAKVLELRLSVPTFGWVSITEEQRTAWMSALTVTVPVGLLARTVVAALRDTPGSVSKAMKDWNFHTGGEMLANLCELTNCVVTSLGIFVQNSAFKRISDVASILEDSFNLVCVEGRGLYVTATALWNISSDCVENEVQRNKLRASIRESLTYFFIRTVKVTTSLAPNVLPLVAERFTLSPNQKVAFKVANLVTGMAAEYFKGTMRYQNIVKNEGFMNARNGVDPSAPGGM